MDIEDKEDSQKFADEYLARTDEENHEELRNGTLNYESVSEALNYVRHGLISKKISGEINDTEIKKLERVQAETEYILKEFDPAEKRLIKKVEEIDKKTDKIYKRIEEQSKIIKTLGLD